MTAWIIIGVILIVIVVPLFSILPSRRQKEQMVMRNAARRVGVSVELREIDDPNPNQDKYLSHIGKKIPARVKLAGYRIQRHRAGGWRRLPKVEWCVQRSLDGSWRWQADPADMNAELKSYVNSSLDEMPEDVLQIEEVSWNIVVYWHERTPGTEDYVLNFLHKCVEIPVHDPVLLASPDDPD